MSIPLDRLYNYIENVARDVYGDTVIYHFYPHGSKNLQDLHTLHSYSLLEGNLQPLIFCHDQEPLNFKFYQDIPIDVNKDLDHCIKIRNTLPQQNLRYKAGNIYDQSILLHSERRSEEVTLYQHANFIPVYYWSHALIALDWYRFAQYHTFSKKDNTTTFLIYNRAWTGTREYRTKFAEQLVKNKLYTKCKTSFNSIDPESQIHYREYQYVNKHWEVDTKLEDFFPPTQISSTASADFDINDYNTTDIEVVLETLFDDTRIHLTEKILRPIACQQPFIILGPHESLKYLRSYGFKTFDPIIDESYDLISDPQKRMQAVLHTMSQITQWSEHQRKENLSKLQTICDWNKQHFFSDQFFNLITSELRNNLALGLNTLENTNTGSRFINTRKQMYHDPNLSEYWLQSRKKWHNSEKTKDLQIILSAARSYLSKNK